MAFSTKRRRARVCVVGAGVIGLGAASAISETVPNIDLTLVAEKFSPDTTSNVSGGLWNPRFSLDNTPLYRLQKWTRGTWNHSLPLALSTEASKIGVELINGYRIYPEKIVSEHKDPWWKNDVIGYRRVPEKELQQLFPAHKDGFSYLSIITALDVYLPYLLRRFKERGGRVEQRKVHSLEELIGKYDVVVNCSGVGARILARDNTLLPLRGQVLRVKAPMQKFFFMEDFTPGMEVKKPTTTLHAFPRLGQVIIGGTKERGIWDTTPNPEVTKDILRRVPKVVPNLQGCEVISEHAGLRPSRPDGVRLETETMTFGTRSLEVVHNYGHEGNGVTLHWGCGQEAAELVQKTLAKMQLVPTSRL